MTEEEKIEIAKKAFDKGWDFETLGYSDYLNNKDFSEYLQEEIWDYVIEIKEIGTIAFDKKYSKKDEGFDDIKKPKHYNSHPSGIQCKEINGDMPFFLGSCVKYIWRAGLKDENPAMKDLLKAREYLLFEKERLDEKEADDQSKFRFFLKLKLIEKINKVIDSTNNENVALFYLRLMNPACDISDLIECIDAIIKDYE